MKRNRTSLAPSRWVAQQLQSLVNGSEQRLEPYDVAEQRVAPEVSPELLRKRVGGEQALHHPPMKLASELDIPGDQLALGLAGEHEVKLYPVSVLGPHHIINDRLDGKPVTVTFCRPCMSGVAFEAMLCEKELSFEIFGAYQGVMAMIDRQTRTIWAHLTGEGLVGLLAGFKLSLLPAQLGTWERWLTAHPDALAPDVPVPGRRGSPRFGAGSIAKVSRASWSDDRLPMDTSVLGVSVGRSVRAYELAESDRWNGRVVHDKLATVPLVILAGPGFWPIAYDRRTPHGLVELHMDGDRLVDSFGSRWDWEGRALTGPLAGRRLRYVSSTVAHWYAWAAYRPGTEVTRLTSADPVLATSAG